MDCRKKLCIRKSNLKKKTLKSWNNEKHILNVLENYIIIYTENNWRPSRRLAYLTIILLFPKEIKIILTKKEIQNIFNLVSMKIDETLKMNNN